MARSIALLSNISTLKILFEKLLAHLAYACCVVITLRCRNCVAYRLPFIIKPEVTVSPKNCCDILLGLGEWRATRQRRPTRLTRREAPHSSAKAHAKRGDVIVAER